MPWPGRRKYLRRCLVQNERHVPVAVRIVPVDELGDALPNVHFRFVVDEVAGFRHIRVRVSGVSVLGLLLNDVHFGAGFFDDIIGELPDGDVTAGTDVHRLAVGRGRLKQYEVSVEDVVHEHEVTRLLDVAVDDRGFAVEAERDDFRDPHVRSHAWTVEGEVAEMTVGRSLEIVVDVTVVFRGALGYRVRTLRMVQVVLVLVEVLGEADHRRGGGVHESIDAVVRSGLEERKQTGDVVRVVLPRLLDARADAPFAALWKNTSTSRPATISSTSASPVMNSSTNSKLSSPSSPQTSRLLRLRPRS